MVKDIVNFMKFASQRFMRYCGMVAALVCLPLHSLFAGQFALPSTNDTLVGEVEYIKSAPGDTLLSIGQRFNLGLNSILGANPGIPATAKLPSGTIVTVPTSFILPALPRNGIVINVPEMRMYYYPAGSDAVMTFPIGIGKTGKPTPLKNTTIVRKATNPTWRPTPSIIAFNKAQGIDLPAAMPPGPDNPLGPYAIYTGIPTYLMHSSIFPESIGRRASFGCIRMNEADIKEFFPLVEPGIPVAIIDMPNKIAWDGNRLFMQTFTPLEETNNPAQVGLNSMINQIDNLTAKNEITMVNWPLVAYLAENRDGVPHEIGFRVE